MTCKRRGDVEVTTGYTKYSAVETATPYNFNLFNPYRIKETWETYTPGKADGRSLSAGTGWADKWKYEDGTVDILLPGESAVGIHYGDPFNEYDDTTSPKNTPKVNFTNFVKWKFITGAADLIGPGLIDIYTGNDLYVDLAGTPGFAKIQTRNEINLVVNKSYQVTAELAGNRRVVAVSGTVKISLEGKYEQVITIPALQTKTPVVFQFTATATEALDITIDLQSNGTLSETDLNNGPILFSVEVIDLTANTQIFYDNFDSDNLRTADTEINRGTENSILAFKGTGFADTWKIYSDQPRYGYERWDYTVTLEV